MQSNTNSSKRKTIQSALSSLKSLRNGIFKQSPVYISNVLRTGRTAVLQTRRFSKPYKTWLGQTSVFTSILILDQMILRSFSIQLDFWYPHVVAVIFCSTTLLWLLVALEGKLKQIALT